LFACLPDKKGGGNTVNPVFWAKVQAKARVRRIGKRASDWLLPGGSKPGRDIVTRRRAAIKNLRAHDDAAVVQVVGERSATVSHSHLDTLAKNVITRMGETPERIITRKFDVALSRFDTTLEAYRKRRELLER
jgi:hypothetical protein